MPVLIRRSLLLSSLLLGCTAQEQQAVLRAAAPSAACTGNVAAIVNGTDPYLAFDEAFLAALPGPSDVEVCPGTWEVNGYLQWTGATDLEVHGAGIDVSTIAFRDDAAFSGSRLTGELVLRDITIEGRDHALSGTSRTFDYSVWFRSVRATANAPIGVVGFYIYNANNFSITDCMFEQTGIGINSSKTINVQSSSFMDAFQGAGGGGDNVSMTYEDNLFAYNNNPIGNPSALDLGVTDSFRYNHGEVAAEIHMIRNTFLSNTSSRPWPTGGSAAVSLWAHSATSTRTDVTLEDNVFDSNLGQNTSAIQIIGPYAEGPFRVDVIGGAMYRNGWLPQRGPSANGSEGRSNGSLFGSTDKGANTTVTLYDVDLGTGPTANLGDLIPFCRKTGVFSGTIFQDGEHWCP